MSFKCNFPIDVLFLLEVRGDTNIFQATRVIDVWQVYNNVIISIVLFSLVPSNWLVLDLRTSMFRILPLHHLQLLLTVQESAVVITTEHIIMLSRYIPD